MIDFTQCDVEPLRVYDGANGKKICVIYNNERYMLKFPALARNNPVMHYSNGCLNEHIASSIYRTLDITTQETILGIYNGKMVVACKDFCNPGDRIVNFAMIKNACIDSSLNGYGTELEEVLQSIEEQNLYDVKEIKEHFWKMFAADAFLGNFDRHNGNWGIIVNELTRETRIAPVYDNGSCLYPQLTDKQMEKILETRSEIENRLYVFPNSALKIDNKKINYYNFLTKTQDIDCIRALQYVTEHISMDKLTLPTAKAGGFLFLPLLHWQIPYGTAMSYTVSTSYIYPVPACPAVQFFYLHADCICRPFFRILMPAFISRS